MHSSRLRSAVAIMPCLAGTLLIGCGKGPQALPPPHMRGKITSVRIEGDEIVQTFGNPGPSRVTPGANYMAYKGGVLRFGKLTMSDADMELIDADPKDPFDFFPDHYKDQLTAGYSKTTSSGGLRVYMPDFTKVKSSAGRPRPGE